VGLGKRKLRRGKRLLSELALISSSLRGEENQRYMCLRAVSNVQASVSSETRICLLIQSDAGGKARRHSV
jgi:hypothetical protein